MDDPARLRRVFKTRLEDFARAVSTDFGQRPRIETLLADGVPVLNVARIAAGKFLNAGQACIAPDYALVHEAERDAFVALLRAYVTQHYPAPAMAAITPASSTTRSTRGYVHGWRKPARQVRKSFRCMTACRTPPNASLLRLRYSMRPTRSP